jgi:hypothetical protein
VLRPRQDWMPVGFDFRMWCVVVTHLQARASGLTPKLTDRRRARASTANPASDQPSAPETETLGGGSVERFVRHVISNALNFRSTTTNRNS